jgi:hypothetical protein
MKADLRDATFAQQAGAVYVTGMWGNEWIDQFPGAGPSSTPYKFKAILDNGTLWIPSRMYAAMTPKERRDYSNYPMQIGIMPPEKYIVKA